MPKERFVKVEEVIGEVEFQRDKLIDYIKTIYKGRKTANLEEVSDIIDYYFGIAIHGIEDHIQHYHLEKEKGE